MIAQVSGRVLGRDAETIVVEVAGIGLELLGSAHAARLAAPGEVVTLPTHLHVREDALQLFAFASARERRLFRALMSVTGVGPKLALAICGAYPAEQLERAIVDQDVDLLSSVSGVGKKTAQRICVDLRDRLAGPGAPAAPVATAVPSGPDLADPYYAAREALVGLGYDRGAAELALDGVDGEVEERVRAALGRMRPVAG